MGRHARPSESSVEFLDDRSAGWSSEHADNWQAGAQPAVDVRPRQAAPARAASTASRPSPFPRTATDRPAPLVRPQRWADDAVAIAVLPPVPTTGARPAVVGTVVERRVPARSEHVVPRRVRRAAERTRKGGRVHGVLVYALGLLLVLSSVYGVARSVGDGENVITDTASSVRSFCFGDGSDEDDRGVQEDDDESSPAEDTSVTAGAEVEEATAEDAAVEEGPAEEPATEEPADASPAPVATSPSAAASVAPVSPAAAAPPAAGATSSVPAGTWLSGASGDGVADGSFAAWRGTPVTISGTWADNNEAMTELWQLDPGGEFGSWDKALDIAIGAISDDESWQQAAQGAYDDRWRASLTNLRAKWGNRTAPLFIRFAHELNGNWYPWSVNAGNREAFVTSWKHFRALQKEIFPAAKLVFSLNRESVSSGFDWRQSFPGAQYVDVIGVDYYNQYPYVASASDWAASLDDVDEYGAPKGLQQHLDFAESVGLPLSIPEWSGHAGNGDSPAFIQGMHDFFAQHAGGGAGQLLYDLQFNIDMHDDDYRLFPSTRMSKSAEMYRQVF